jgi:hypothetical protein
MMIKNFLFYAFSTFINEFAAERGPGHMARVWGICTVCGFVTCVPMCKWNQVTIDPPIVPTNNRLDVFGKVNRVWVYKMWSRYLGDAKER